LQIKILIQDSTICVYTITKEQNTTAVFHTKVKHNNNNELNF